MEQHIGVGQCAIRERPAPTITEDSGRQDSLSQLAYCGVSYCGWSYSKTGLAELSGPAGRNPKAVPAPVDPSVESEGVGLVKEGPVDR